MEPWAVVTGQPGIGKSFWIYYALRRCLAERKPVIWYYQGVCQLFTDQGVYRVPATFPPGSFKSVVWTLVDSDESRDGIPQQLIPRSTRLFVIYVTSPAKERWSRLDKTVPYDTVIIMNPWTRKEIHLAAPLRISEPNLKEIDAVFDLLGPTPRLCFNKLLRPGGIDSYKRSLTTILAGLTSQQLMGMVVNSGDLAADNVSHNICLISRNNRDEMSDDVNVRPITKSVESRLVVCLLRGA